ncbi:MAG: hypothetical protein WBX38_07965 [Candidatus Sulfotelmatobacter sp.]
MDAETKEALRKLLEQFMIVTGRVARLESDIAVLSFVLATQLQPDRPLLALKFLQETAGKLSELDPSHNKQQAILQMMDAVNQWKKSGSHQA